MRFDTSGDEHYDLLSAFQKSIRGSDENAAVFYLARILEGGDLLSACRRLMVCACEDVGLAYPMAATVVKTAWILRWPSACRKRICRWPRRSSCWRRLPSPTAPCARIRPHLKTSHAGHGPRCRPTCAMHTSPQAAQRGKAYRYPHDYPNGYVRQQYLPDELKGRRLLPLRPGTVPNRPRASTANGSCAKRTAKQVPDSACRKKAVSDYGTAADTPPPRGTE